MGKLKGAELGPTIELADFHEYAAEAFGIFSAAEVEHELGVLRKIFGLPKKGASGGIAGDAAELMINWFTRNLRGTMSGARVEAWAQQATPEDYALIAARMDQAVRALRAAERLADTTGLVLPVALPARIDRLLRDETIGVVRVAMLKMRA